VHSPFGSPKDLNTSANLVSAATASPSRALAARALSSLACFIASIDGSVPSLFDQDLGRRVLDLQISGLCELACTAARRDFVGSLLASSPHVGSAGPLVCQRSYHHSSSRVAVRSRSILDAGLHHHKDFLELTASAAPSGYSQDCLAFSYSDCWRAGSLRACWSSCLNFGGSSWLLDSWEAQTCFHRCSHLETASSVGACSC